MRDNFAAFILTHGRPNRVITHTTLRRCGYTGPIYIVIDDEDETADQYREIYGNDVLTFSKAEIAKTFDIGDNFTDRRVVVYARNALWDLAKQVGVRYFVELDDDYAEWSYRMVGTKYEDKRYYYYGWTLRRLDDMIEAMLTFMDTTPTTTIAFAQGGDQIGGAKGSMARWRLKRKAMNSFICDTHRPFTFIGRINEDVNTYVTQGRTGKIFFTYSPVRLNQLPTQANPGGLTDFYLDGGTYVKSFYTIMYAPSCTTIRPMGPVSPRLHHRINWNAAVPKIVSEEHRHDLMETVDPKGL